MNLAKASVLRPVAVTMRIAALVLMGVVCVTKLPVDLLPNVSAPTVAVITQWPNVAPEEIESQLTRPIEEAVSSAPNVYTVQSSSVTGSSSVRVQFRWGTDVGQAAVDVLQIVERARQRFPNDPTLDAPTVFKFDPTQMPIMNYAVSGENDPVKMRTLLDNEITPIIEGADGVASAVATGGNSRAILVNVDPVKLQAYHIGINDVGKRLIQENQNVPAGIGKQSNTEYTVRSLGWFISPQQISKVPLTSVNGRIVTIGDVATVQDSQQEARMFTRLGGAPAGGLIITKQSGANTIDTARSVQEKIKEVEKRYPYLHFELAYDQSQFISNSIDDLKMNALLGGILAVLILLFFLRNVRSTAVVALSIPISIISTFALLYVCGFTLNTMTLGGLALATGLIADDAVVVLENIYRHFERDRVSAMDASIGGANEILSAVVASTVTVVVVFLPLLLIKGQAGQMFTQFALVVIFSVSISLLDATTVVPMLASRLVRHEHRHEHHSFVANLFDTFGDWFDALDRSYRNGLSWALSHRSQVIAICVGVTLCTFLLLPQIGSEMLPQTDSGNIQVNIKLQPGTALTQTDSIVRQVEGIINSNPNVQTAFSSAGSGLSLRGTSATLNGNQGAVLIRLRENRKQSTQQIVRDLQQQLRRIPGGRISVYQVDIVSRILSGGNSNVEVDVYGDDLKSLAQVGDDLKRRLSQVTGLNNVDVNWQDTSPEMQWVIDRDKAIQLGVTFQDVANAINTATNGATSSYYQEKGYQYPIIVQFPVNQRKTEQDMANIPITPSIGGSASHMVLLSQVAHLQYANGPGEITRQDRQRYIAISGQPDGRSTGDIEKDVAKIIAGYRLPEGFFWKWGYGELQQKEEFGGMGLAIMLAIGLIYMLLAAQFESFVHPLTILCSVPVASVGVVLALFLTGRAFGLTALIGILMLIGIVVKNGILLVDYTNVLRGRGMDRNDAVLTAGPTRLRPILMTSSATILGMMPIAMQLGKGSETNAPMATAVIGGLLTSTLLTLFIVPTVYTLFDDLGNHFRSKRKPEDKPLEGEDDIFERQVIALEVSE